jgi:hypothetical protein
MAVGMKIPFLPLMTELLSFQICLAAIGIMSAVVQPASADELANWGVYTIKASDPADVVKVSFVNEFLTWIDTRDVWSDNTVRVEVGDVAVVMKPVSNDNPFVFIKDGDQLYETAICRGETAGSYVGVVVKGGDLWVINEAGEGYHFEVGTEQNVVLHGDEAGNVEFLLPVNSAGTCDYSIGSTSTAVPIDLVVEGEVIGGNVDLNFDTVVLKPIWNGGLVSDPVCESPDLAPEVAPIRVLGTNADYDSTALEDKEDINNL